MIVIILPIYTTKTATLYNQEALAGAPNSIYISSHSYHCLFPFHYFHHSSHTFTISATFTICLKNNIHLCHFATYHTTCSFNLFKMCTCCGNFHCTCPAGCGVCTCNAGGTYRTRNSAKATPKVESKAGKIPAASKRR